MTPDDCYHSMLERYFEVDVSATKEPCGVCCSYCLKEIGAFTKRVHRDKLQCFLSATVFTPRDRPSAPAFMKALKSAKGTLFHENDVPKKLTGQIHGLALQLVAKGIIKLDVSDKTKIGTKHFKVDDVCISLPVTKVNGVPLPAYAIDDSYSGLNTI